MSWLDLFDKAERVRTSCQGAYRDNLRRINNDPKLPATLRECLRQGMLPRELALALTLGAFYEKFLALPAKDAAVLCEVAPLFFVEPKAEAVSTLAEYCVFVTKPDRANIEFLVERFSTGVRDSQFVPFTASIHERYPEWVSHALDAGVPWRVLVRPAALESIAARKAALSAPSGPPPEPLTDDDFSF